jgi:hypothetical protein
MAEWTLHVQDELDSQVRSHVAKHGGGTLTEYVEKAVRRQMFWDTVETIRTRNADVDPQTIEAEVNQAVDEVRANRS